MNTSALQDLATRWREEAGILRNRGAPSNAGAIESCAEELEQAIGEWELEELSLEAAAQECGYAYDSLQKKVARNEIPNAGTRGSPRVRRCDLPFKAGRRKPRLVQEDGGDLADEVLAGRVSW